MTSSESQIQDHDPEASDGGSTDSNLSLGYPGESGLIHFSLRRILMEWNTVLDVHIDWDCAEFDKSLEQTSSCAVVQPRPHGGMDYSTVPAEFGHVRKHPLLSPAPNTFLYFYPKGEFRWVPRSPSRF